MYIPIAFKEIKQVWKMLKEIYNNETWDELQKIKEKAEEEREILKGN